MPPSWEGMRRRQRLKQVQGADGCDELGAKERATGGGEKLMKAPPGVGHQGRKKSARMKTEKGKSCGEYAGNRGSGMGSHRPPKRADGRTHS